jgi:hypothetical protein
MLAGTVVAPLSVGTEIAGYRIEGVLGRGGMGIVYEATQLSLGRTVALKLLAPLLSHDPIYQARFRREGVLQAAIDHPHIVTVHEAGSSDAGLFIAMRLIRGPSLKDELGVGPLDPARALVLLAPLADALDSAHEAGLIHRDVKPQNVLIGPGDHAYLADFGLTKGIGQTSLTATGGWMGTPSYMAPELVEGGDATASSDIYAFAAMLYEGLTGQPPFPRPTQAAVLYAHATETPPRASERRPGLAVALDAVLARGLAKTPADRPTSASELMRAAGRAFAEAAPGDQETPATTLAATLPAATAPAHTGLPTLVERDPRGALRVLRSSRGVGLVAAAAATAGIAVLLISSGDDGEPAGSKRGAFALGSALRVPMRDTFHCDNDDDSPCVVVQTRLPGRTVIAPRDGKVHRWQVKNARGTFRLVVLRRSSGGWAIVRRSDPVTVNDRGIRTLAAADLSIRKGDAIGLDMDPRARVGWHYEFPGADLARWTQLAAAPQEPEGTGPGNYEMALAADVKP